MEKYLMKQVLRLGNRSLLRNQVMLSQKIQPTMFVSQPRNFFSEYNSKDQEKTEKKEENDKQDPEEDKKETKQAKKDPKKDDTSSSDEELDLSNEDIKKIRKVIMEQDKEIEELKESVKKYKEKLVYQMAENDNTVKRYKSEIEKTKSFAISKFAKDLLDVRDSLGLADKHLNMTEVRELSDIDEIKKKFENVAEGMTMTSKIMDHTFQRYGIEEFNPMGDKFDTSVHEAVFMIPKHEKYQKNQVGEVMQTGWKIGDRVLRPAKVGVVQA